MGWLVFLVRRTECARNGGTSGGVRFEGETRIPLITLDGLAARTVYGIVEDASGALWFATNGCLSRFIPTR